MLKLAELAARVVPPSVTYWYRLEPRPRGTSLAETTAAPVRDPLWFLTRQWQMGEFIGVDAGSPAYSLIASTSGSLTSWNTGGAAPQPIPADTPLEPLIEREPVTPDLALSVELGQTFEQLLQERGGTPVERDAFRAAFPLQLSFDADPDTARFFSVCSGRCTDGIALLRAIEAGAPLPPAPAAALADFQSWVAEVFGEIGTTDPPAWNSKIIQYDAHVQGLLPQNTSGDFSAIPARDGAFDWFAFDLLGATTQLPPGEAVLQSSTFSVIPTHVRFRGMPNAKWWDFENNITDFGGIDVQRQELAKLAVMDFLLLHGNDWFLVPISMPVNSLYRIDLFLVRDVFGGLTLIDRTDRSRTATGGLWTMFSTATPDGVADFFLLPPTAAVAMQTGFILEDVRFLRDPTSNMDWAIEHQIEGGIGQPLLGREEDARRRVNRPQVAVTQQGAVIRYQIESSVPRDWFPFVPVATGNVVNEVVLRLGELLPDIHGLPIVPSGRLLPGISELREQEIPRTGIRVTRVNMRTRWLDASTHSWIARRRTSGRGEGSSGLQFDLALPQIPALEAAPPPQPGGSESGTVGAVLETGADLIAPRFFGDDVLASCLSGHRIFAGSGDPPETVARIQQALADLGFAVTPDGDFGPQTGTAVTQYKTGKGISPNDPVVGPETAAALDRDFAHELFDAKAAELAGTRFDLGARIGTRVDLEDGLATCAFENGICVEIGHVIAYGMPAVVASAWLESGGTSGTMGAPTSDPLEIDATRSAQEFTLATRVLGGASDFTLPRAVWEAALAGQGMIGSPKGAPQPLVTVQYDEPPAPLPQVVAKVVDAIPLSLGQGGSLSLDQLAALAPAGSEAIVAAIRALLPDLVFQRLFDETTPAEIEAAVADGVANDPTYSPPNFENFLLINCPPGFDTEALVAALKEWLGFIETAYTALPVEPAAVVGTTNPFFPNQQYLSSAPVGIGVQKAWATGADGTGTGLIDIEHAWFLQHEDLPAGIPLLDGINRRTARGHGTAVLGVIAAIDNAVGVVGIAPKATIRLLSVEQRNPVKSGNQHAAALMGRSFVASARGDVVLLEIQIKGGTPAELDVAVFQAIRLCTARDIIVVEAAGNGSKDLDNERNSDGVRALNRSLPTEFRDSGAIVVGACISGVPHSRLPQSSFGNRIDCYAWGENVFTAGRREDPVRANEYFNFSGTSSAAAIIAGVCLMMQHLIRIVIGPGATPFTTKQMRKALSDAANGTASDSPADRIGVMPDFAKLLVNEFI